MVKVIKKDGTKEDWNPEKIKIACRKASERALDKLSDEDYQKIINNVSKKISPKEEVPVDELHAIVESTLLELYPKSGESYRQYRNYKKDFIHMMDKVYVKSQGIRYIGDVSNANTDSTMNSTQRSLIYGELNRSLYKKFFLNSEERQAAKDGYIYIHDEKDRLDGINCCLMDIGNILNGGFEMGNLWYTEPKTLDVAFDVISDITMSAASQQYGGFTIPEVDTILVPYAEKSYKIYYDEYVNISNEIGKDDDLKTNANNYAMKKVQRDFEQGFQSWEMAFNSVGSSRGDYPFIAISFGIDKSVFGRMATSAILKVRKGGQGKEGFKRPVLFPKLTFLYDENLHGKGKELEYLFEEAIDCSSKCMYPDFLSLTGDGYIPSIYKKYNKVVSLMGCVDGEEIITYKFKGNLFVESFKRFWNKMSNYYNVKEQIPNNHHYLYIKVDDDLEIYDTKNGFVKVKTIIRNTNSEWVKVKFKYGRQIMCTPDHPFPTNNGRIKAEDLTTNDKVTIIPYQYSEDKYNFDPDKAWVLGLLICDSNYTNSIKLSIAANGEDEIEEKYIKIMKTKFGVDVKTIVRDRGSKGHYKDIISTASPETTYMISYLNSIFGGINKINRHIPNEVFSWNYESRLTFLAGMIDADGYINPLTHGGSSIQIGSTNKELSLQQMALVQSLGMEAYMYENHYDKKDINKIRYRIEFVPSKELVESIVCKKKRDNYIEKSCIKINNEAEVISIEHLNMEMYSYDVETETDMFDVSGILSHNCRASLSPWFERGGMHPADESDIPIFIGRCNLGALSLHLPMILAKSRQENKDFYEVLDYYLELIRNLHKRTYEYLGEKKASTNPIPFTQGGFLGGTLKPDDKIKPLLKAMTMSFGVTALNELQYLYNGKSLVEDSDFAYEVMVYINKKVEQFKEEDGLLYAIYGVPAESLCGKQVEQFRKLYGVVKGVSDRPYVSNSFHCGVWEHITPIEKQDKENRFWNLFNGGKIQYCRYPVGYNKEAIKTLVRRAMKYGYYEGVNLALCYCETCGYEQVEMTKCPKCGSEMITQIDRMNGYLGYTRINGKTRYNEAKVAEIKDRVSM